MNEITKDFKGYIKTRHGWYKILQITSCCNKKEIFSEFKMTAECIGFNTYYKVIDTPVMFHFFSSDGIQIIKEKEYLDAKLKLVTTLINNLNNI